MHKYAAYVVGDENIEIGALAALSSFKKNNPEVDLYLYSYIDKMSTRLIKEYNKLNVKLIDINSFINVVDKFTSYSSGELHWPKEVFLNYYIPTLLVDKYEYSIKLDYDLLTMKDCKLDVIRPKNQQILSSVYNQFSLLSMIKTDYEYYEKKYGLDQIDTNKVGINTGFLVINNRQFVKQNIFNRMVELVEDIKNDDPNIVNNIYADQGLLTMLIGFESIPFKYIKQRYNVTTVALNHYEDDEFVNFHYTGMLKPWKNIEVDKEFITTFTGLNYMTIEYWREYMKEHHSDIYETLQIKDEFIALEAMIVNNKIILQESNKIKRDYTSIKYTTKRLIYLILKKVGLK